MSTIHLFRRRDPTAEDCCTGMCNQGRDCPLVRQIQAKACEPIRQRAPASSWRFWLAFLLAWAFFLAFVVNFTPLKEWL